MRLGVGQLDENRNINWSPLLEQISDTQAQWCLKRRLRNGKTLKSPIHGVDDIVFTDKRKDEAFATSLEKQFSPNRDHYDDLRWEENNSIEILNNIETYPIRSCTVYEIN